MRVTVLGSGSWGSALAKVLSDSHHEVLMWGLSKETAEEINQFHTNHEYLPKLKLDQQVRATVDLKEAVHFGEVLVVVVPTKAIRSCMEAVKSLLQEKGNKPLIVHASKGLEPGTHFRVSQIIEDVLERDLYEDIVVLSGPSHAEEVAVEDLTTITAACENIDSAVKIQKLFMNPYFRVYSNTDVVGVELGAALKNIIAICAGINDGLGYGDNSKSALITRGLAEISRLGVAMGADPLTFAGLSGVGDLIVTCTSQHSRNWQAGNLLAQGYSIEQVNEKVKMIVEGISTCKVAYELAQEMGIEMPITESLYRVIYEGADVHGLTLELMTRQGKQEGSLQDHLAK